MKNLFFSWFYLSTISAFSPYYMQLIFFLSKCMFGQLQNFPWTKIHSVNQIMREKQGQCFQIPEPTWKVWTSQYHVKGIQSYSILERQDRDEKPYKLNRWQDTGQSRTIPQRRRTKPLSRSEEFTSVICPSNHGIADVFLGSTNQKQSQLVIPTDVTNGQSQANPIVWPISWTHIPETGKGKLQALQ